MNSINLLRNLFFAVTLAALAGCEPVRPPSAPSQRVFVARQAQNFTLDQVGSPVTKLIEFTQPNPPTAKSGFTMEFKVFNKTDKANGTHIEWTFFHPVPGAPVHGTASGVLMAAWLLADDGSSAAFRRPELKEYGTFLTDWMVPAGGTYHLFALYQPAFQDETKPFERSVVFPVEVAHKVVTVAGEKVKAPTDEMVDNWLPSPPTNQGGEINGEIIPLKKSVSAPHVGQLLRLDFGHRHLKPRQTARFTALDSTYVPPNDLSVIAVPQDGSGFQQFFLAGSGFDMSFPKAGRYRLWTLSGDQISTSSVVLQVKE